MEPRYQASFLMARIHQTSGRIFESILKDHGLGALSPSQGRIMFALWKHDMIPIQELVEKTSLSKSTLTVMLDHLEGRGLVVRVPSERDRREILIRLTDRDRSLRDSYELVSEKMAAISYAGFSENEIHDFEKMLERILHNLMAHERRIRKPAG